MLQHSRRRVHKQYILGNFMKIKRPFKNLTNMADGQNFHKWQTTVAKETKLWLSQCQNPRHSSIVRETEVYPYKLKKKTKGHTDSFLTAQLVSYIKKNPSRFIKLQGGNWNHTVQVKQASPRLRNGRFLSISLIIIMADNNVMIMFNKSREVKFLLLQRLMMFKQSAFKNWLANVD